MLETQHVVFSAGFQPSTFCSWACVLWGQQLSLSPTEEQRWVGLSLVCAWSGLPLCVVPQERLFHPLRGSAAPSTTHCPPVSDSLGPFPDMRGPRSFPFCGKRYRDPQGQDGGLAAVSSWWPSGRWVGGWNPGRQVEDSRCFWLNLC